MESNKNLVLVGMMGSGKTLIGKLISKQTKLFGYKDTLMQDFNLENIQFLINKKLIENKLIKPVYEIN